VIEAGLKAVSAARRSILTPINLEDGRKTLDPKTKLAKKYGASLVALTIDGKGQCLTPRSGGQFEVRQTASTISSFTNTAFRRRICCSTRWCSRFLPGMEQHPQEAPSPRSKRVRLIKQNRPWCAHAPSASRTALFGLSPYTRQSAEQHGTCTTHWSTALDSAILHAAKIMPLSSIDETGNGTLPPVALR